MLLRLLLKFKCYIRNLLCIIIAPPYPIIMLSFSLFFQIARIAAYLCGTAHQLLEKVETLV